eukprot:TRINITY_DN18028_c0_g1_i5.p1 TRINITY_DN18028_c0_g1~~TRINITY_DN18028_c0_g1_i5.p1  ORF type:complete len:543 (-),score=125.60 TRINITY_DN18028_c0_g1_i5:483-1880(-)
MRVYGQVSAKEDDRNVYANPVSNTTYSAEYPHSDPVLSDCTDDYAEPAKLSSPSISDNIYSQAFPPPARPPFLQYCSPATSHQHHIYQDSSWRMEDKQFAPFSSSLSSPSSADILYSVTIPQEYQALTHSKTPKYSKVKKPGRTKTSEKRKTKIVHDQNKATSKVNPNVKLKPVNKSQLKIVERLGTGQFGEVHLCHYLGSSSSSLVAVKSLDPNSTSDQRLEFEAEARILSAIDDPNIARVLGVNLDDDPWFFVREFSDQGDLTQYLQDHVAESSLSTTSGIQTLSYGALIYMGTQIASGMACLSSVPYVHRDLATRNCLVYPGYCIKISDCGSAKPSYSCDYYRPEEGEGLLPIRWMAWEAVLQGVHTTKSDVWAFGVTLWEILTFAREQPYEALSDNQVIENLSELSETGELLHLSQPYNCPRDVFDLMSECWLKEMEDRPTWTEIVLFLKRKNLGFDPLGK